MKLLDVMTVPWAISPERYQEHCNLYLTHLRGEKIDIDAIEARVGFSLQDQDRNYEVSDGIAIIDIQDVLTKKSSFWSRFYGGTSMQEVRDQVLAAVDDEAVKAIILNVDSPGGTVDGTQELADAIYNSRGAKPIIAFTDGMIHSAAYWIASAADEIYISGETNDTGGIGVVSGHADWSKAYEEAGIKITEIYKGKYKRITSMYKPLSEEGKRSMQDDTDYLFSIFVNHVARNRGVETEVVLESMSTETKSTYIGQQAIDAGLVDGVSTMDQLINKLAAGDAASTFHISEENTMDIKKLKAEHLDVYKAAFDEGAASVDAADPAALVTAKKEGADGERGRIQAVMAQDLPGHSKLIMTLAFDGVTTGPEAAVKVLGAENTLRATGKADFDADAVAPVNPAAAPDAAALAAAAKAKADADKKLPVKEQAKASWDANADGLQAEFDDDYESYESYFIAKASGNAKVLGA